ncbi:MAG TPA: hypothetical protein PLT66_00295 [Bacillota bacterium]|nr:hypothetical protein [Bacillota bacterium]
MRLLGISSRKEWLEELSDVCGQIKLLKFKGCSTIEEAEAYYKNSQVDSVVIMCESYDMRSFLYLERLCAIRDELPVIMITDNVNNELYFGAVQVRVADIIVGEYDAEILDAALDKVVYSSRRTTYKLCHEYINDSSHAMLLGEIAG